MIRALIFAAMFSPVGAFAQGAILETLDELKNVPEPPAFRASLPERAAVANVPPPRDQADTSACVSWAVTYAAASQAARRNGVDATATLAPAFTYNQVSGDRTCWAGTSIAKTLDFLRDNGALPMEEFAFDAGWCGRIPTEAERKRALRYRIKSWSKFDATDINAVKGQLARGVPVIFSMRIGTKMRGHRGDSVLESDYGDLGGHAMVAVGYDDSKRAFRIQNSWGRTWADAGYGWFSYDFWKRNARVAFVID
jgi:C1A family cysteine protease